jgi:hypothetical protein
MKLLSVSLGVVAALAIPGAALAQAWTPASEIVGQGVPVTTNGITNTVYLDPGGSARIMTPGGNVVPGTWTAANCQLCLNNGTTQECWPYAAPFQAGQPVTLTSSCNSTSTWLASSINGPATPTKGERGR